ncbi:Vitamin B12 import ATP-binding protein BtuD [Candidatus Lokiarchaeum ossiferum]|uniref:Vitamin B12 import ATP-binding protein BtuD n=1 Tax=Candidatus Lokiarchaeum ossiferum TaxID=2951803 RepID=A0ABY6HTI2_9ARCH|nr:Vitamin B12 import ATP-binding protein BtuD [Candidatus Lokiarchaeum sp. B-35]
MSEEDSNEKNIEQKSPAVSLEGVYKIYKQGHLEVIALNNIDLTVYPGELVVIMGPSGSGKTTLLNIIAGLERPNAGSVKVKELEISRLKDEGIQQLLQNDIGIIFQFFNLIPSLTAAGNVEMPMIVAKKPKSERKTRVEELLNDVGLKNRTRHRPFTLSGGEKQRVAIAQAFANNPKLILADEPTGNIDSVSAEKIMGIFHQNMEKYPDKAMIIVTHDPAFRKIADRTYIIRDGQFVREIGKMAMKDLNSNEYDYSDENSQIIDIKPKHEQSKVLIEEPQDIFKMESITECPICHSKNILKGYDKNLSAFHIHGSQMITTLSIACLNCHSMNFQNVAIFNVKKDLV